MIFWITISCRFAGFVKKIGGAKATGKLRRMRLSRQPHPVGAGWELQIRRQERQVPPERAATDATCRSISRGKSPESKYSEVVNP